MCFIAKPSPLSLSLSLCDRGQFCLVPWIQSNKYGNKQRARETALQFAGCLSTLPSIKMRDKSKACLILACGGRAQTQTICLCVITQCTVRGKGERYNRCRGEAHAAYYGCWETQKRDYGMPENRVTVIILSHLTGKSGDKAFKHCRPGAVQTHREIWGLQRKIDGMPEDNE